MRRLLVTANVVPSSPILVTLMMEATRATRHNISEDGILHSHRRENLKSYKGNVIARPKAITSYVKSGITPYEQMDG
jgi:hypothetical protein